jgi:hypothetical protein
LGDQWSSLSALILEKEVGSRFKSKIHDRLLTPDWPDESPRGQAPAAVRLSGAKGRFRLELLLEGKVAGSWMLGDTPVPAEFAAALELLDKTRPGDFDIQVRATKQVLFSHLKFLMASLGTRGFRTFSVVVENDASREPAR